MQRIVNESDYCKKWNLREARKLTMVFFFKKKCQRTGVLNYKRMFRHLLEIYTLYVTIETFICFSTYSTWVVYVISRLFLLCVTFFHFFYRRSFLSRQTGNFAGAHNVPRLKFAGATFKTPERSEGQKCAMLKFFTLVKWFMSFCEAFLSEICKQNYYRAIQFHT